MDKDDAELERILAMTEEELRAECIAEGRDWDMEIAEAKVCFELAFADVEFERWLRGLPLLSDKK